MGLISSFQVSRPTRFILILMDLRSVIRFPYQLSDLLRRGTNLVELTGGFQWGDAEGISDAQVIALARFPSPGTPGGLG